MLAPIRDALHADGYEISVAVRGPAVEVTVTATAGACADCLVPESLMTELMRDSLVEGSGGRFEGSVLVTYPPASGDGH
jgi:hypothetical protein